MKKLKSDGNTLNRLSELPDSLIHQILSLLDMREIVRTTLISKRWKDFWVTIPCLKFDDFRGDVVQIRNFVYRTLTLWRGTHLREFRISISSVSESEASLSMDMALWVHFATERKVEDLCIKFHCCGLLCPPQCLYECSSIRKLLLRHCNLQIRGNVKWDHLNTLELSNCDFSEDVMNQVFSSSPQLETLTISCYHTRLQNFSIRSSSLKKLWIDYFSYDQPVLTIWAPNLELLEYLGTAYFKFLLNDISSLTEVHLHFPPGGLPVVLKEALCRILPVIQHVVTVELSASCFKVLRAIKRNYSISPLLNVKLLTIGGWSIELNDIVGVFECFPKLKKLIYNCSSVSKQFKIDAENYIESEANNLKSNLLLLQTVVITWNVYEASFFEFAGFLLKHATMIEKMVIRREGVVNSDEMFEASKKLMSLQRSFPSAELILCER